jgi:hypothetical protein
VVLPGNELAEMNGRIWSCQRKNSGVDTQKFEHSEAYLCESKSNGIPSR